MIVLFLITFISSSHMKQCNRIFKELKLIRNITLDASAIHSHIQFTFNAHLWIFRLV